MAHAADPEEEVAEAASGLAEPVATAAMVAGMAAAAAEAAAMVAAVVSMVAAAKVADAVQTEVVAWTVGAMGIAGWTYGEPVCTTEGARPPGYTATAGAARDVISWAGSDRAAKATSESGL